MHTLSLSASVALPSPRCASVCDTRVTRRATGRPSPCCAFALLALHVDERGGALRPERRRWCSANDETTVRARAPLRSTAVVPTVERDRARATLAQRCGTPRTRAARCVLARNASARLRFCSAARCQSFPFTHPPLGQWRRPGGEARRARHLAAVATASSAERNGDDNKDDAASASHGGGGGENGRPNSSADDSGDHHRERGQTPPRHDGAGTDAGTDNTPPLESSVSPDDVPQSQWISGAQPFISEEMNEVVFESKHEIEVGDDGDHADAFEYRPDMARSASSSFFEPSRGRVDRWYDQHGNLVGARFSAKDEGNDEDDEGGDNDDEDIFVFDDDDDDEENNPLYAALRSSHELEMQRPTAPKAPPTTTHFQPSQSASSPSSSASSSSGARAHKRDGRYLDAYLDGERDQDELRDEFAQWLGARDVNDLFAHMAHEERISRAQRRLPRVALAVAAVIASAATYRGLRGYLARVSAAATAAATAAGGAAAAANCDASAIAVRTLALRLAWLDASVLTGAIMLCAPLLLTVLAALIDPYTLHTDAVRRLLTIYVGACLPLLLSAGVLALVAPAGVLALSVGILARVAALYALYRWSDLNTEVTHMVASGADCMASAFRAWQWAVAAACAFGVALRAPPLWYLVSRHFAVVAHAVAIATARMGIGGGGGLTPTVRASAAAGAAPVGAALLDALRYPPYYALARVSRLSPLLASVLLDDGTLRDAAVCVVLALVAYATCLAYYLTRIVGWRRFLFGARRTTPGADGIDRAGRAVDGGGGGGTRYADADEFRALLPIASLMSPSLPDRPRHLRARQHRTPLTALLMHAGWLVDDRTRAPARSVRSSDETPSALVRRHPNGPDHSEEMRAWLPHSTTIVDLMDEEAAIYGERATRWNQPRDTWLDGSYEDKLHVLREYWAMDEVPGEETELELVDDTDSYVDYGDGDGDGGDGDGRVSV